MDTSGTGDKPRRVIKRYSNRKLYDTKDSRYVTLQQIGEMVRAGEEVQIIDNATKEDKTEVTLALIISEDLKSQPRSVPLGTLRDLIQERGERLLSQLREGPIGRLIPGGSVGEDGSPIAAAGHTGGHPQTPGHEESAASPGHAHAHAHAHPQEEPARGSAEVPPAPPSTSGDSEKPGGAKGRLTGIVESSKLTLDHWQHTIDERIRAILPGVVLFRDLKDDVKRLTQRVEELEARLNGSGRGDASGSEGIKKE